MHQVSIRHDLCVGDGLCVRQCFRNCLELNIEKKAVWNPSPQFPCVGCGHCTAVCPTGAITLDGVSPETLSPSKFDITEKDLERLLSSRRSIRIYQKKPIPRTVLQKVLNIACYAPTGANLREVGYIIVDSPEKLQELRLLLADWMQKYPRWSEHFKRFQKGEDTIFRGAAALIAITAPLVNSDSPEPSGLLAPQNAAIAASYLEIALHGLGLGSCWCGLLVRGARNNSQIRSVLHIPDGNAIHAALLVGYPAIRFPRIPQRNISSIQWL